MEKAVTSDPFLLAGISEQALEQGGLDLGPVSRSISVDEVLSPLGISHLLPALVSESCNEDKAQGGEGHSCRDQNQKNSRHRCLPCPLHGLFSVFASSLHNLP